MEFKKIFLICIFALLVLTTGCSGQNRESAVSSGAESLAKKPLSETSSSTTPASSNVSSDNNDWMAYIDNDSNLCIKKKDDSNGKVIVKDVYEAPCVAGEWVYYLPDLDEIDKVKLDGSQKTKVCDTDAFQVYNANLDIYHEINGSTSVTAEYKDGYILYTCFQLKEEGDKNSNPPSYYKLDLDKNTLTQVKN
jgi:hypothetical protein